MTQKVAFITGVTGQYGAYLSEFILKKGYIIHGLKRRYTKNLLLFFSQPKYI